MANELESMLMVEKGLSEVSVVGLGEPPYVFGKSDKVDVVIDNPFVSRRHCKIVHERGGLVIRDIGSKNGTYVNGVRLQEEKGHVLKNGDQIELGRDQVVFRYQQWGTTMTLTPIQASGGEKQLRIDNGAREVWIRGQRLEPAFARKEFDVLALLYGRFGDACSKDEIAEAGWPERHDVADQDIEQYIRRIRLRIEPDPSHPQYILNVRGYGYKLVKA